MQILLNKWTYIILIILGLSIALGIYKFKYDIALERLNAANIKLEFVKVTADTINKEYNESIVKLEKEYKIIEDKYEEINIETMECERAINSLLDVFYNYR